MTVHILVIDDSPRVRETLRAALSQKGYEVVTAANGELAFESISRQRPDLIISDLEMPKMDGFMFYKQLRANFLISDIPVIIMTEREKTEDTFRALGIDGFIIKPVDIGVLTAEVQRILNIDENGQSGEARGEDTSLKKVFLLGGNIDLLDQMTHQAERAGYKVVSMPSRVDVVETVKKFKPDIIFVDVMFQGKSLCEVVYSLRTAPQMAETPIIGYNYYTLDKLENTEYRQNILGIHQASKDIVRSGATAYMGRYNHQLFLRTLTEFLGESGNQKQESYSSQMHSLNKLEELLSIADTMERQEGLVKYAKDLKVYPVDTIETGGGYNEEKLVILIFDASRKRQKSKVHDVVFFVLGIFVGVGLILFAGVLLQLLATAPEDTRMINLGGSLSSEYGGPRAVRLATGLPEPQDSIYIEPDYANTLVQEYHYENGELIENDGDNEPEEMIIRKTFSEE